MKLGKEKLKTRCYNAFQKLGAFCLRHKKGFDKCHKIISSLISIAVTLYTAFCLFGGVYLLLTFTNLPLSKADAKSAIFALLGPWTILWLIIFIIMLLVQPICSNNMKSFILDRLSIRSLQHCFWRSLFIEFVIVIDFFTPMYFESILSINLPENMLTALTNLILITALLYVLFNAISDSAKKAAP